RGDAGTDRAVADTRRIDRRDPLQQRNPTHRLRRCRYPRWNTRTVFPRRCWLRNYRILRSRNLVGTPSSSTNTIHTVVLRTRTSPLEMLDKINAIVTRDGTWSRASIDDLLAESVFHVANAPAE